MRKVDNFLGHPNQPMKACVLPLIIIWSLFKTGLLILCHKSIYAQRICRNLLPIVFCLVFFRMQSPRNNSRDPRTWPRHQRKWQKERDSSTMEFYLSAAAQSTRRDPENTAMMKKKCPRFGEEEGSRGWGNRD